MKYTKYQKALKIVLETIKKDKALFYAFQSNIAMAFFDEFNRKKPDIHEIANVAAIKFLSNLVLKTKK